MSLCNTAGLRQAARTPRNGMKNPRSLRLALSRSLLGPALFASPLFAVAPAESPISAAASPIAVAGEPASPAAAVLATQPDHDQKNLSAELAAAWKETELLKAGLTAQLADANKRVAIAEAALASKDKAIAALQIRLDQATAPTAAPIGVSAELASLKAERDQLQAAATAATGELAELRVASAKATAEQTALRTKLVRAIEDISAARRAQNLAEAESASLKAAADRASAERLAAAAQLEVVTTELEKVKASAPKATELISDTGLTVLKADRDRLAEAVKTLEHERDALTAQLAVAKASVAVPVPATALTVPAPVAPDAEAAVARLADLQKAKAETDTKLEASLRTFTLQQAEIDRLQKALASIDEERAAAVAKLDSATTELSALRPQAATAAAVSNDADTLRAQLAAANQSLAEKTVSLSTANLALADARKTVDTATAELVATRDQLRQTQAQSAAFAVELQQVKTRLALTGSLPTGNAPSRSSPLPSISIDLPTPAAATPPAATPAKTETPSGPRTHTVVSGDSLSRISKQYYGTSARWNDILLANKDVIRNPDALTLGTQIRIP